MQSKCNPKKSAPVAVLALTLTTGGARAAVVYDESVSGDLINGQTTSPWQSPGHDLGILSVGASSVLGTVGRPPAGSQDTDVLTWTVAPGTQLDAIWIDYSILEGDNGNGSYLAIASGSSVGTGMATAAGNLSDALVPGSGDLLTAWAAGPYQFGAGLSAPLGAGTYTLWFSEIGAKVGYDLSFQVSAVPEPETWAMLLAGLGLTSWAVRRRQSKG